MSTLQLFGVPELRDADGRVVKLRTKKQLALLVYLVLEGRARAVSRETLIDLFWSDTDPVRGRHSLAQALTAIRGALGKDALSRGGDSVRFVGSLATDLDTIDHTFADVDLTGPLARLETWAGADFAHWVDAQRHDLKSRAAELLRSETRRLRSEGSTWQTTKCAAALRSVDPYSELAVQTLAEQALFNDHLHAAISLLRSYADRVRADLKCNPNRDILRLIERLETGSYPTQGPADVAPDRSALGRAFVGRQAQLEFLERNWREACRGRMRSVLLIGPPGIGKTSLLHRFSTRLVARAHLTFTITCHEIAEGIPYAALADLAREVATDPSVSASDPMWLAEISRVHPGIRARYPGVPEAPSVNPEAIGVRLAEAFCQLLDVVRETNPMAILVDDIHYLDRASGSVLHLLQRRLEPKPILLIATERTRARRSVDLSGPENCQVFEWDDLIDIPPIHDHEVESLLESLCTDVAVSRDVQKRIVSLAEGNPHFVEMLLTDWQTHADHSVVVEEPTHFSPDHWTPPESLRMGLARLYADLPELTRSFLQVLAVAARSVDQDLAANVLAVAPEVLSGAILESIQCGIVRLDDLRVAFKNEVHRRYVYYATPPDIRTYRHSQLARELERTDPLTSFQTCLETGYHLLRSGQREIAYRRLIDGSKHALAMGAPAEARTALTAAVLDCPASMEAELRTALAHAEMALGAFDRALEATTVPQHITCSGREKAELRIIRTRALTRTGGPTASALVQGAHDAIEAAHSSEDTALLADAYRSAAEVYGELGLPAKLEEVRSACEILRMQTRSRSAQLILSGTLGYCNLITGSPQLAATDFRRGLRETPDTPGIDRTKMYNGLGIALTAVADHRGAERAFREVVHVSRQLGNSQYEAIALRNLAVVYHDSGRFEEAADCYKQALECLPGVSDVRATSDIVGTAAGLALDLGAHDQADDYLAFSEQHVIASHVKRDVLDLALIRADLFLANDEPERAWTLYEHEIQPTPRRDYVLGEAARYVRLARHFKLATEGLHEYRCFAERESPRHNRLPLAAKLEVEGFDIWADPAKHEEAERWERRVLELGLLGVIAHLDAVGTVPLKTGPGTSPATRLVAHYDQLRGRACPTRIEWDPPTATTDRTNALNLPPR